MGPDEFKFDGHHNCYMNLLMKMTLSATEDPDGDGQAAIPRRSAL